MTEIYIDKADLNMYQLKPAPPKWDLQEYIVTYLKEKDNRYLAWFLHYYEKTLNNNVQEYMRKLFMPEHFADMKQAYIAGLLKALKNYDIKQGVPFTSFKERYVDQAFPSGGRYRRQRSCRPLSRSRHDRPAPARP